MILAIDPHIWAIAPGVVIGTVVARGIDNESACPSATDLVAARSREAHEWLAGCEVPSLDEVAPWREVYRAFGVKPSKYRSSIESMLRSAGNPSRSINPLVDIYNAVSLGHRLPCGGEDIDRIVGELRLTVAVGTEEFRTIGATEEDPPQPGEVIYRDDAGVVCRCWNWREADRTKLTHATTNAFLCIEALPPLTHKLEAACEELAELVSTHLGGRAEIEILRNPSLS